MYLTLTNVQSGDAIQLQQPIDNSEGDLYVGLRSSNYPIGWYNLQIQADSLILWNTDPESTLPFSSTFIISDNPGLFSYTAVTSKINAFSDKFSIIPDKTTGKISLKVNPGYAIIFSDKLASMLNISSTDVVTGSMTYYSGLTLTLMKFTAGTYISFAAINLAPLT